MTSALTPWLKRLLCWIFGHAWSVVRPLEIGGHLVECSGCQRQVCYHPGRGLAIEYDAEIEHFEIQMRKLRAKLLSASDPTEGPEA